MRQKHFCKKNLLKLQKKIAFDEVKMNFSIRQFMLQLLICVIIDKKQISIRAHSIKNHKLVNTFEKSFEDRTKAFEYIKSLSKDYQISYTSCLCTCLAQGLVPTLNVKELEKFGVNVKNVKLLSINNAELFIASNYLDALCKDFEDFGGLDFTYSPLALLYFLASKQNLSADKISLCVYRHSSLIAVMIVRGKEILFGSFFDLAPEDNEFQAKLSDKDEEDAPSDLNSKDIDLNALDKMLNEKLDDIKYSENNDDLSNFGNDMQMNAFVFKAVNEFYNNELYKGSFIDEMLIFDDENMSQTALDYIEGEIYLKPKLISIDSLDLMNDLMRKELKI